MKALTLHQPWATLVAIGAKRIETRSWSTQYRGPLLIHAAERSPASVINHEPFYQALKFRVIPRGAVLAVVNLIDVIPTEDMAFVSNPLNPDGQEAVETERAFGDFTRGRFAWILSAPFEFDTPIPMKGARKLWTPNVLAAYEPGRWHHGLNPFQGAWTSYASALTFGGGIKRPIQAPDPADDFSRLEYQMVRDAWRLYEGNSTYGRGVRAEAVSK